MTSPVIGGWNVSLTAASSVRVAKSTPSMRSVPWPRFDHRGKGELLVALQPQLDTSFATRHHCDLWAGARPIT